MISQLFTAGPFWSNPLLQSTVCIAVGLIVSLLLRRRSARAHQVLFLAMIAAVVVPAMSMIVRHYELGMFVDNPAVTKSQFAEIHIVPIITEYEISPVPAIPNAYYPEPIEPEYAIPAAAVVREAKAKLPLSTILIWSWIIVSTILAARLFVTFILGLGMLRRALPLRCDKLGQALLIAKGKLGIDKPVQVLAGHTVSSPVIWCWSRRPALLVPEDTEQFEDSVDWVGMFCHELAHWSRLDHISGLFAELMVCLFPWHPLMWLAKSRLAGLSEQACDDWVVAGSRSPTDYAESLLGLTPQGQLSFLPAVVGRKNGLESRIRRIVKDKCGKPHLGLCWAVVVTLIAACITIGAAFAQIRPADTEQAKEYEKHLSNEHKHESHTEEHNHELLAQEQELLAQQQKLLAERQHLKQVSEQLKLKQLEQQQLGQLGSQLQLEQLKQKKNSEVEAVMQLRLAHLKNLNALVQQQTEYRLQADVLESEIKILQQDQGHMKKLAAEGKPGLVPDKVENEVRQLEAEQLLAELKALREKIDNIESRLQASLPSNYVLRDPLHPDVISNLYGKTTHSDPIQQVTGRDQLTQYKYNLQIEADNLQQELDFLEGLRQDELEKAETHQQMCATLKSIDKIRQRIRSIDPPIPAGGELFKDDELAVLKKIRSDLQILTDKTKLQIDSLGDKKAANKLRGELDKIDAFIQYIDGRINSPAVWPQQRLQSRNEYEAKRKELLPKRRELEELRKHAQHQLKQAPSREDAAILRAALDEIDKNIRGIDFELISPEWCAQKRKAEQTAMQKYNSEMDRAKDNFNIKTKRRGADYAITEFDDFVIQRKTKTPVVEGNPWNTTPRQIPPAGRDFRRRQQIQTTTPQLQQGQGYSPWQQPQEKQQPGEKLQSRINQLQDEIRRLRGEMTEMRKLMKDLVEQKKKRPGKPLPEIHGYPLEPGEKVPETLGENIHKGPKVPKLKDLPLIGIVFEQSHKENPSIHGKKQPKKPLPEIHGEPLEPENIEPTPSENKHHEHIPDEIPNETDEILTTEPGATSPAS